MKIKLPSMRLPMSTRIGYRHVSERDYDRNHEKMDIEQRVQETLEEVEEDPCKMDIQLLESNREMDAVDGH